MTTNNNNGNTANPILNEKTTMDNFAAKLEALQQLENDADTAYFEAKQSGKLAITELNKLKLSGYKFANEIAKITTEFEQLEKIAKIEAEKQAKAAKLDLLLNLFGIEAETITTAIEAEKTTMDLYNEIKAALISVKPQAEKHIAMGTTGKQMQANNDNTTTTARDGSIKAEILNLLQQQIYSYDQLRELGYTDGTIRYTAWEFGYNKNRETGIYYKK